MNGNRFLVIDDDPVTRDLLADILCGIDGYQIDVAPNGKVGVREAKAKDYDIIFTDLTMPELNGLGVLKEVQKINPCLPVVVVTGMSTIDVAINVMKEGANDFITKPFKVNTITSTVERILGERRLLERLGAGKDQREYVERLNAELFGKLQKINLLQAIHAELDSLVDNHKIYQSIVAMASKLLLVREASFGIIEEGYLKIKKAIGVSEKDILVKRSFWEDIIKTRRHYLAGLGEINPHTGEPLSYPFLSLPFLIKDVVFGLLNLANKADGSDFTDDDVSLALTLVNKTALRIENNVLYEVVYNNLVNSLKSLVISIEARDPYTRFHSERVTAFSLQIAEVLGLSDEEKDAIKFGGYLHDIGKIGIRDGILLKPGPLNGEERSDVRQHPIIGDNILKPLKFFPKEREIIRYHHEWFNGKGYPERLAGKDIPLLARVLALGDAYDAMTSSRPYRKAMTHEQAIVEIIKNAGEQFDEDIVQAFFETAAGRGETLNDALAGSLGSNENDDHKKG
ncbi:MAG: HD domain-containing phosphohydrolase [Thermodesulfobacteriota bacterium]